MNSLPPSRICTNSSCGFDETGQCVEGNDTAECPFVRDATGGELEPHSNVEAAPTTAPISTSVRLSTGANLELSEASLLLKSAFAPIVAFVGPVDAGKTSLIAEVYDAFQYGGYRTLKFAGSRSLVAFEEACHMVRAASNGTTPTVNRTPIQSEPMFYHLCISVDDKHISEVLLADRSGETYEQVKDAPGSINDFLELKRANIINVLVDGDKLCNPIQRARVISQCAQTVQALVLSGALAYCDHINLILTKLDLVDGHVNSEKAHEYFDALPDRIAVQCSGQNPPIYPHKISACPHNDTHPKGKGVEDLVRRWLQTSPPTDAFEVLPLRHTRAFARIPVIKESL